MIAHLRGKVEQIVDGAVVLDVGGIGFYVRATAGVLAHSEMAHASSPLRNTSGERSDGSSLDRAKDDVRLLIG